MFFVLGNLKIQLDGSIEVKTISERHRRTGGDSIKANLKEIVVSCYVLTVSSYKWLEFWGLKVHTNETAGCIAGETFL
jgi:hypothetical protein